MPLQSNGLSGKGLIIAACPHLHRVAGNEDSERTLGNREHRDRLRGDGKLELWIVCRSHRRAGPKTTSWLGSGCPATRAML